MILSRSRVSNNAAFATFDAESEKRACSLVGLPTSALTDKRGMAALALMARILLCLSSGVMCGPPHRKSHSAYYICVLGAGH